MTAGQDDGFRHETECPVAGCEWVCRFPLNAIRGADLALAEHLRDRHVDTPRSWVETDDVAAPPEAFLDASRPVVHGRTWREGGVYVEPEEGP